MPVVQKHLSKLSCCGSVMLVLAVAFAPAIGQQTSTYGWDLPKGVAPPRVPATSPMTVERVELGRHLFYDTRLSGNGKQACASCHLQNLAFTDGRAQAIGSTGQLHPRSSMSLINVAYRDALTWSNPTLRTFEDQVLVPLFGTKPVELGLQGHEARVYAQLAKDPVYRRLFAAAFPGVKSPVSTPNIAMALSSFLRSIVSFRSPFDRYRFKGDQTALSPSATRGMKLFFSEKARCGGCHMAHNVSVDLGLNLDGGSKTAMSPSTDPDVFMFHNTGLYNLPGSIVYPADNTGLYAITGQFADVGKFRVPSLRNIAVTAPYMHDGSIGTLEVVLDHYIAGGRARNPRTSESIKPLTLDDADRRDLITFLDSLTDTEALRDPRWSDPWKNK
jgi:cytochrome c peroxidase